MCSPLKTASPALRTTLRSASTTGLRLAVIRGYLRAYYGAFCGPIFLSSSSLLFVSWVIEWGRVSVIEAGRAAYMQILQDIAMGQRGIKNSLDQCRVLRDLSGEATIRPSISPRIQVSVGQTYSVLLADPTRLWPYATCVFKRQPCWDLAHDRVAILRGIE